MKLNKNQVKMATVAVEKTYAFFTRQVESGVISKEDLPPMPQVQSQELQFPDDVDVVWSLIHTLTVEYKPSWPKYKLIQSIEGQLSESTRKAIEILRNTYFNMC